MHVLVKINYSQWWYTVGWSPKECQVGKSLLTNCHLEDETGAGQKCWVKTKSLCCMYSTVNDNTIQQCMAQVMADVMNNMYFQYFYNVSEGYSRTLSLYKWHVSLHFYLTYHSVFPKVRFEGEGEAAWALSLLHLILSSSFPFCFISCNLLPHSFPVGLLFGSVFFDLIHKKLFCACMSLLLVPFGFTKFLSLMTSIKFFLIDFLKYKEFSLSSLHWWR